jgi:hypothetical protein
MLFRLLRHHLLLPVLQLQLDLLGLQLELLPLPELQRLVLEKMKLRKKLAQTLNRK